MKYWYITYTATGHTDQFHMTGYFGMSPAEWSIAASEEYDDGPYIVLHAEEIDEEQYTVLMERYG